MTIHQNRRSLALIGLVVALGIVMSVTIAAPAFAIKRFFNCMTDIANKSGKLSVQDVNKCYDKEYHTGPLASLTHSVDHSQSSSSE